ncbi:hypothetical protein SAMN05443247_08150 [Bradyrhizobium erythrophlei]|nr:hypothetical protein SAMN05443247_08150 [Bradyrhizobium erythrophlei]
MLRETAFRRSFVCAGARPVSHRLGCGAALGAMALLAPYAPSRPQKGPMVMNKRDHWLAVCLDQSWVPSRSTREGDSLGGQPWPKNLKIRVDRTLLQFRGARQIGAAPHQLPRRPSHLVPVRTSIRLLNTRSAQNHPSPWAACASQFNGPPACRTNAITSGTIRCRRLPAHKEKLTPLGRHTVELMGLFLRSQSLSGIMLFFDRAF